jgi:hypothetical protein
MSFDPLLPATGVTQWADLYQILRNNFNALNDMFAVEDWKTDIGPSANWTVLATFKYLKDPFGFVHLTGKYRGLSSASTNPLNAALPVGYRPSINITQFIFMDPAQLAFAASVTITTAGVITVNTLALFNELWFDNVVFKAA